MKKSSFRFRVHSWSNHVPWTFGPQHRSDVLVGKLGNLDKALDRGSMKHSPKLRALFAEQC